MERSSGIMYASFHKAIRGLSVEDQAAAYDAIFNYMFHGEAPPEDLSPIALAIFLMAKPQIDANTNRFINGKKGGRPKNEKPMVSESGEIKKPMVSENDKNEKPNVNDNVNVNDNDKDNKYIAQPQAVERPKKEPKKSNAADFDYFWTLYPKRVAKQAARKAFDQALKKASPGDIFVGAKAFADWCIRNGKEPQYIPYPATWLRAERWRDELIDDAHITPWEKERKAGEQRTNDAFANVAAMLGGGADGAH